MNTSTRPVHLIEFELALERRDLFTDDEPATVAIVDAAGLIEPIGLRRLDAIHLATAIDIRDDCDGFITYDDRLAHAARHHGLSALAPR